MIVPRDAREGPRGPRLLLFGAVLVALGAGAWYLAYRPVPAPLPGPVPSASARAYTVRGVIEELPEASRPSSSLFIRHEAIPDFADQSGKPVGMSSMTMAFPVARGASLDGLSVGDKVEFVFEVDWSRPPFYQVTRIALLPADTALRFGVSDGG